MDKCWSIKQSEVRSIGCTHVTQSTQSWPIPWHSTEFHSDVELFFLVFCSLNFTLSSSLDYHLRFNEIFFKSRATRRKAEKVERERARKKWRQIKSFPLESVFWLIKKFKLYFASIPFQLIILGKCVYVRERARVNARVTVFLVQFTEEYRSNRRWLVETRKEWKLWWWKQKSANAWI